MPAGRGFTEAQGREIGRALRVAREQTGLRFSVWVGETCHAEGAEQASDSDRTGAPARARDSGGTGDAGGAMRACARRLHAALGPDAPGAVLIAIDPAARKLEIVTGEDARRRLDDRTCALAAMSMSDAFSAGDLTGGIRDGVAMLAEHARQLPSPQNQE